MKRKVILMGGKTFVISLPSTWVKRYGISKSEELDIEELDRSLIIKTEKNLKQESIKIDILNLNHSLIWRYIFAAYIRGSDEIQVNFSMEQKELVITVANKLIGCTIVDESETFIRIKDIGGDIKEFERVFRRLFHMLSSLVEEGIDLINNKEYSKLQNLKEKDYNINYSVNFCLRFLNKKGYSDLKKAYIYYSTLRLLEFLSDEFSDLFDKIGKNKLKIGNNFLGILNDIKAMYDEYSKMFFKFDEENALEMVKLKKSIIEKIQKVSKKVNNDELIVLGYLRSLTLVLFNLIEPKIEDVL